MDGWAWYFGRRTSGTRRAHTQLVLTAVLSKLTHQFEDWHWESRHKTPVSLLLWIRFPVVDFLPSARTGLDILQDQLMRPRQAQRHDIIMSLGRGHNGVGQSWLGQPQLQSQHSPQPLRSPRVWRGPANGAETYL